MALGMVMGYRRHASVYTWAPQYVWCPTCAYNSTGRGATSPSLELTRKLSTLCTETICETMGAMPCHDGVVTYETD